MAKCGSLTHNNAAAPSRRNNRLQLAQQRLDARNMEEKSTKDPQVSEPSVADELARMHIRVVDATQRAATIRGSITSDFNDQPLKMQRAVNAALTS